MEGKLVEQTRMRAGIARRMRESKQQAPHFYVQTEVTMDRMLAELQRLNEGDPPARISVTAALVRACASALRAHPAFNGVWTDDGLLHAEEINIGVAIALEDGLLAPALARADRLSLSELAVELRDLAQRAQTQRLTPSEISDATFTLSNLGMFDVSAFTAIITPPQLGILATARPVERWLVRDGEPRQAAVMTATLSADHRAVDGVGAARFLETFKTTLENPELLVPPTMDSREALH
jgi:pyruvate dehydrogenase E2 component (dihydrolipoamide acetyltransferase)